MSTEDKELAQIFRYEERPLHPDTVHVPLGGSEKPKTRKASTDIPKTEKPKEATVAAQRELMKPDANWLDKIKACATWALGFGGLSMLLFYWEQAGLMAESIADPCMCVCTFLVGWGVAKNAR